MRYNLLLRRKGKFDPVCTVLDYEIQDDLPKKEKERIAAAELIGEHGFYVELEPIKQEKTHRLAK